MQHSISGQHAAVLRTLLTIATSTFVGCSSAPIGGGGGKNGDSNSGAPVQNEGGNSASPGCGVEAPLSGGAIELPHFQDLPLAEVPEGL